MKEAFDPKTSVLTTPETENGTSTCMENNITNDVVAGRDSICSSPPCMRPGDTHVLSLAKEDASNLDYQSNYDTSLGSHAYSEEEMSLRSGYHRQHPFFSSSDCSWENSSSASEAMPSSPDASGNVVAEMGIKSNIFGPRPDYLASYPSTGPHMRRLYTGEVKADLNLDYHSEHWDRRSDRSTTFSNCNGQSIEHINEIGTHHVNVTTFPSQLCFDNGGPSLLRGLQYGDEIPSLSSQNYGAKISSFSNRQSYGDEIPSLSRHQRSLSSKQSYGDEIPSLSHHGHSFSSKQSYGGEIPSLSRHQHSLSSKQSYGDEIPSLSRSWHSLSSKHNYGDEIPSLSRNWRYQDKIHLHCRQSCHDAEAHPLPSYQRGASHGNGHSRNNFVSSPASNQRVKITTNEHTLTRPRVANRAVNSTDHYMINKKDNTGRNSEDTREQVCGPRSNKLKDSSTSKTEKDIMSPLVHRDQFNRSDFSIQYEHAKFFMIKSYSEDDIHKGIKYNVWASTPNGNNKLDAAFREAQIMSKEKGKKCPVFLFFSVNSSGQFVGLAEVLGPVDFKKTMDFWKLDKWNGFFPVMWHVIKDIPNRLFKHIILENNDNRPVTFSRDTQEIGLPQGLEMLKLFKDYHEETSLLDDFNFYEEKGNARCAEKGTNADSMHEARLLFFRKGDSDDLKSMK